MMTARRAVNRVHAVGAEFGITHEHLHLWAVDKGFDSLADMPDWQLDQLSDWLETKPGEPERFLQTYWCVNAPSLLQEVPLFTAEQQAALDADADRIQSRFRTLRSYDQ